METDVRHVEIEQKAGSSRDYLQKGVQLERGGQIACGIDKRRKLGLALALSTEKSVNSQCQVLDLGELFDRVGGQPLAPCLMEQIIKGTGWGLRGKELKSRERARLDRVDTQVPPDPSLRSWYRRP
ncbi:hypothetical protein GCM10010495_57170 [Kitasatospora herbaricolor]|nr:hypothetical protein GCM10010495_57170 [Kitasatospora herbaricolor]